MDEYLQRVIAEQEAQEQNARMLEIKKNAEAMRKKLISTEIGYRRKKIYPRKIKASFVTKEQRKSLRVKTKSIANGLRHPSKETRRKVTKWTTVFIVILFILIGIQYAVMKWQMTKYQLPHYENVDQYREYACVQMSYDAEKQWEELGFHVVQRRVMSEHRWIAIEMLPGVYVEFESTLNILGMHLITPSMTKKMIYQSEGFFENGKQIINAPTSLSMHGALTDWKAMWYEKDQSNIGYFSWVIWPN
jgi:hypothetical protein